MGIEIYSTGGTARALRAEGLEIKSVSELTNFPEILGGRVKTLHPAVHAGLLADLGNPDHVRQLDEAGIGSIDLVVINLYPFEQTLANPDSTHAEMIENIDIGGPAMIRASAKNYKWTAVIVNPARYEEAAALLRENGCTLSGEYRCKLAGEAFSLTGYYDSVISGYFNKFNGTSRPAVSSVGLKSELSLRYGENPHQSAELFGNFTGIFRKLHGKELSYNNIVDINAAAQLIVEFDEPTVAIIKHTNPSGVASGANLIEAYDKAYATDTVSPYGGIIIVNRPIDKEMADHVHSLFTELIIAPEFTPEALGVLTKKRDRRLIAASLSEIKKALDKDIKSVVGGFLMQDNDNKLVNSMEMKTVTNREPDTEELEALLFAWKVCKHVKSNAIVYAGKDRTLGIGAGQMSRVDSSKIAIQKANQMGLDLKGCVIASDAYFPFPDGLIEAAEAGVVAAIQPGGSVRDSEVIAAANEKGMAMVFTGMRHFRH